MPEQPLHDMPPLLAPVPRRVDRLGGQVSVSNEAAAKIVLRNDGSIRPQGYSLRIAATPEPLVVILAGDQAGARNGSATLRQLIKQYGAQIPSVWIEDWPEFAHRGLMLDVSRDRVPTNAHLAQWVDRLAALKMNHFQLYTEHTFGYAGHEEVWKDASPIMADEVRALNRVCLERGVELAANQNCFGHLHRWLTHPKYAHLAETHDEYDFYGLKRRGPHSLCPIDPASLALVEDWLDQLLPLFTSKLVNIGCDETADVGFGRSKNAVAQRGAFEVYIDFVRKVAEAVVQRGKRPMFWADVALRYPEQAREIPADLLCLVWGYEAHSPFAQWCSILRDAERDFWICPGTSAWRSILGRTTERKGNLRTAINAGMNNGASGMLITEWGDLGHRQQAPIALLALTEAANAAWNPSSPNAFDPRAASLHVFNDRSLRVGAWLEELGDVDRELRMVSGVPNADESPRPLNNASALFEEISPSGNRNRLPEAIEGWRTALDRISSLRGRMPVELEPLLERQLRHTLDVAEFAARLAIARRSHANHRNDLRERLVAIIAEHRALWLIDSRIGGLNDSAAWYENLLDDPQFLNATP